MRFLNRLIKSLAMSFQKLKKSHKFKVGNKKKKITLFLKVTVNMNVSVKSLFSIFQQNKNVEHLMLLNLIVLFLYLKLMSMLIQVQRNTTKISVEIDYNFNCKKTAYTYYLSWSTLKKTYC